MGKDYVEVCPKCGAKEAGPIRKYRGHCDNCGNYTYPTLWKKEKIN